MTWITSHVDSDHTPVAEWGNLHLHLAVLRIEDLFQVREVPPQHVWKICQQPILLLCITDKGDDPAQVCGDLSLHTR